MSDPHLPPGHDGTLFQYMSNDMGYISHKPHQAAQTQRTIEGEESAGLGGNLSALKAFLSFLNESLTYQQASYK